jgi:hypothetical protein
MALYWEQGVPLPKRWLGMIPAAVVSFAVEEGG